MHDLRALVVDDSKVGRLTMMKKLEAMGLKVELAESGQQALDYLAQHRPDLIFMDHMMPEMDGFEVTRRLKASPATLDIPVIIISGNDEATFVQEARKAGAIDAIAKPPATDVLENLLASLPKLSAAATMTVAPKPAAAVDMAELQALVERLLGTSMSSMREELIAKMEQRLELASETGHKTQVAWNARLDQQVEAMADIRRGVADVEALGNRLQSFEQRLLPLEAEAGKPPPDFNALHADIEQRIASGLTALHARADGLTPQLENLHQGLKDAQASVETHAAQVEQKTDGWNGRLDTFAEELAKVTQDMQSMRNSLVALEQRMDQRLAQLQEAASTAAADAVLVPEAIVSPASEELQAMQAELYELHERLSESRLQQLVAETVTGLQPTVAAEHAVAKPEAPPAPPVGSESLQAELAQLRSRVKTLTIATAIGGVLLLAAIGVAVLAG